MGGRTVKELSGLNNLKMGRGIFLTQGSEELPETQASKRPMGPHLMIDLVPCAQEFVEVDHGLGGRASSRPELAAHGVVRPFHAGVEPGRVRGNRTREMRRGWPTWRTSDRAELSGRSIPEEHDVVRLEINDSRVCHDKVVQMYILIGTKPTD